LDYDPENRFLGFTNIRGENFLRFLTEHASEERAFQALCAYYDSGFECVLYLLQNRGLWNIHHIRKYLMDTLPSFHEFTQFPSDLLYDFYCHDTITLSHLYKLEDIKQSHVLHGRPLPSPPIIAPIISKRPPIF